MVTHALDYRSCAGVAHGEALPGHAVQEGFTGGGAVEHDVAHQNALLRQKAGGPGRIDDDATSGESLA